MATKTKNRTPKIRRTNAERTAETRGKLIDAAIDTLYRSGYSSTTTIEVAKRARVSRGAMLHHFPTRVSLLMAAAQHIVSTHTQYRRSRLSSDQFETPLKRFYAAADVSWEVHSRPTTIALLEIMMATRSDAALRKGLAPFIKAWSDGRRVAATNMAADLGIKDATKVEHMIALHQASLRGLAIELMFTQDPKEIESARNLLAQFDRMHVESLIAQSKASGK